MENADSETEWLTKEYSIVPPELVFPPEFAEFERKN